MRPPTSTAVLRGRSFVLSLSCFLFVLLLSVSFAPSSTLAADGPPFSPCQVTSIRLSTLDGSQAQDVWSDGQYKSLVPFKLSSSSSDKTQLRAQVTFVIASEASWRSVVPAQVNNDGFVQYFRAPGGDRADPPTFEQELQGFRVTADGDKPNHLVINADCVSMFEADVSIVVGDDQAGGGEGAGGGSDGNAGGGAGSSEGGNSGGADDGNSGSPTTTPPPDQGASNSDGASSTAPELIDADGNGVPDNPYATDNPADANTPDDGSTTTTSASSGGDGGDGSVSNNDASSGGASAGADVGASSSSSSGSSEIGGQDGSVNQLGGGNSAASTMTVSLTLAAVLTVGAAAVAL